MMEGEQCLGRKIKQDQRARSAGQERCYRKHQKGTWEGVKEDSARAM